MQAEQHTLAGNMVVEKGEAEWIDEVEVMVVVQEELDETHPWALNSPAHCLQVTLISCPSCHHPWEPSHPV